MAEDEERRSNRIKAGRRGDTGRGARREPPVIEGKADEIIPEPDSVSPVSPPQADLYESGDPSISEVPPTNDDVEAKSAVPEVSPTESRPDAFVGHAEDSAAGLNSLDVAGDTPVDAGRHPPSDDQTPKPWDSTPAADEPPSASPPRRSSFGIIPAILGILVLLLLAAVAYLLYDSSNRSADLGPDIATLKTRVAGIEARPPPAQAPIDTSAIDKRLDGYDSAIAGLKTDVAALATRMDAMASTPAASPSPTHHTATTYNHSTPASSTTWRTSSRRPGTSRCTPPSPPRPSTAPS